MAPSRAAPPWHSEDLLSALVNARVDLVVSAVRSASRGITATPLTDEEFVLVGSLTLARTIDTRRLGDDPIGALAHLPLVAYAEDLPIIRRYWRSEFARRPPNATTVVLRP
ncbi:LysR substrate-binding domain-containing protein [Streptomyces violaceusniger]|uniref:LysR substrate-binding domain-containing protein n=1 Tax=Streptomyces violaceusniger TaxID=68280 RepID=UPI000997A5B8|nr:LysR substrate-binding domain-containing protein [Streptomyces hygroscopicus]AQW46749.1 LysR family transcriptional regulator [Streptomyces hygroscopicus]